MELRHLEYFVSVAEELSFTRAARRMHVVQSGISSAIQGLERELGAALFERDRHRVALTDAGRALLPEARATLGAAQAARDAVGQVSGGLRGTLTIGTMLSMGAVDLPALLGRFHATHPGVAVRLRISAAGSAGLAREVQAGSLDLALASLPGPPPAGLAVRPVAAERLVLACGPAHPLASGALASGGLASGGLASGGLASGAQTSGVQASGPAIPLEQLAGASFIDFPPGWGNRAVVDRAFAAAGLDRQVPFEVADFAAAVGLIRHGLGIAFLPSSVAAAQPGLGTIELSGPPLIWSVFVVTPVDRRMSAAARAFLSELPADGK